MAVTDARVDVAVLTGLSLEGELVAELLVVEEGEGADQGPEEETGITKKVFLRSVLLLW